MTTTAAIVVATAEDLVAAAGSATIERIDVVGEIANLPTLSLAPGQRLAGGSADAALVFTAGVDGVQLSRDNTVDGLRIAVEPRRRAIFNDPGVADLGTLRLAGVTAVGQVEIVASGRVGAGHVEVDGLEVIAADTRDRTDRPELLGVGVLPGAFTLWNRRDDAAVVITADLRGISAGRDGAAVRGSGVFVAGPGRDGGGRVAVSVLETGPVFTDGGIAEGTSDTITGGVFVLYGASVGEVRNLGPVTTYGVNDMVLDNWGTVDRWTARAPLTSYGRSGVGMVNFGAIGTLHLEAPIETHGPGGRGFNVYRLDGYTGPTVDEAEFDRITTHGDGAIGIQIGQPVGRLIVHKGVRTHGGAGESLVRGAIVRMPAHAVSVQPGGRVASLTVEGDLVAAGDQVAAVEVRGQVGEMRVAGGVRATGAEADGLRVESGTIRLYDTDLAAGDGAAILATGDAAMELENVTARGGRGGVVVRP